MIHLNKIEKKNKNNNTIVITSKAATTLLILATIVIVSGVTAPLTALGSTSGEESALTTFDRRVPVVLASEEEIYIAWSTNNTENGNEEVMFRASNDGGATFGDTINLSNTTDAHSWRIEIDGDGADVIVAWWETNQTSDTPVARMSTDGGQTFSPMLRLATSGTISSGIIAEEATTAAEGEEATTAAEGEEATTAAEGEEATTAAEGEGETVEEEAAGGEEVAE
jgi:hypothetical protein